MDRVPVAFELVTPPTCEPLSLDEAKSQCRLDGTNDFDTDLTWLIEVAREKVETDTERAFLAQTRRLWIDRFPRSCGTRQIIEICVKPVVAVNSIKYLDASGDLITIDPADYVTDLVSSPCRIAPAAGKSWPITLNQVNAVQVEFACGASSPMLVPAMARHAMRLLLGHWFENREAVGKVPGPIALGYESLINALRWH